MTNWDLCGVGRIETLPGNKPDTAPQRHQYYDVGDNGLGVAFIPSGRGASGKERHDIHRGSITDNLYRYLAFWSR